jgi:hypothetical protein
MDETGLDDDEIQTVVTQVGFFLFGVFNIYIYIEIHVYIYNIYILFHNISKMGRFGQ